ncbi:hypothetical protein CHISP_2723 [Chitinispirillum alkaliphilum]|nr:hypothetical protein CHISP_2723 [Chitinispirillum alkaliphilum]
MTMGVWGRKGVKKLSVLINVLPVIKKRTYCVDNKNTALYSQVRGVF